MIDHRRTPTPADDAAGLTGELGAIGDALRTPGGLRRLESSLDPMPWWLEDVALPGGLPEARGILEQASQIARTAKSATLAAWLDRRLAAVLGWGFGRWADAEALLLSAVEALHWSGDRAGTAAAATQLAWLRGMTGDLTGQLDAARDIAAAAHAAGDEERASRAAAAAAWAAAWTGRPFEVEPPALAEADDAGGKTAASVRALSLALAGRPAAALGLLRSPAEGDEGPAAIEARVVSASVAGHPTEVLEVLARSDVWPIGSADCRRVHALALGAFAAIEADDGEAARRVIHELDRLPESPSADQGTLASWARLTVTWREDGARAVAPRLADLATTDVPWTTVDLLLAAAASSAAREAGDLDAARRVLVSAETASTVAGRAGTAVARLARADAALLQTADAPSDAELVDAVDALDGGGLAGLAGLARSAHARLAAADGRREAAIDLLTAAAEDHLRSGRARSGGAAIRDLTALGQGGRRAAAALGAAPLTPREREIASLAADGLTAQAIADRLVISRRTVETHLAHIYAKLAVGGRRELERRAEEFGLRGS